MACNTFVVDNENSLLLSVHQLFGGCFCTHCLLILSRKVISGVWIRRTWWVKPFINKSSREVIQGSSSENYDALEPHNQ
jgi:hypothetical protein